MKQCGWFHIVDYEVKWCNVNVNLYSTLWCYITKVVWYCPRVTMGPNSFTLHPHTNHTDLYSPATRCHRPFGWYSLHLSRPHWIDLAGWLHTKIDHMHWELNSDTITHPSTNQAQRRLTLLIETSMLSQCQTANNCTSFICLSIQLCVPCVQ